MKFTKLNQIVQAFAPQDINGATLAEDYVCMKNYNHLSVIVAVGAAAAASTVTLKQATNAAGAGEKAVTFTEYALRTGATADTFTDTSCSSTFNIGTTTGSMYVIEIDATALDQDNNFSWVRVDMTDPSASDIVCVLYVLSEPRYAQDAMLTTIA